MAQPKHAQARTDEDPQRAARRAELENLSKKADAFVQKRNDLNRAASQARSERDLLNDQKKQFFDQMRRAKAERDAHNKALREHKELRGLYQQQAKELISKKRGVLKKEGKNLKSPVLHAQELLAEIRDLEFAQETQVLTTAKENELIKQIRLRLHEYHSVKKEAEKAKQIQVDLSDTDRAIDELFARAESEHQAVLAEHKASQAAHERYLKVFNDTSVLIAEADQKHKLFLETRVKADEQHQQFLELRAKILEVRGQDAEDRRAARVVLKEQHQRVRQAVADPRRLDEVAERSLEELKKGGRIRLG